MKTLKLLASLLLVASVSCSPSDEGKGSDPKKPTDPITEYFTNEVRPAATLPCFDGAYYHKVVSSKDRWVGIEGEVVLPTMDLDTDRWNPNAVNKHCDNPSVYMGGTSNGQETDIGLAWEQIVYNGERVAYRPFLRRTAFARTGQAANFMNGTNNANFYWYPGDVVTMRLELIENGLLKFTVEGEGKYYEQDYECDGYDFFSLIQFKRVNAIDQMGNEGKPVQASKTKIENGRWNYTKLLRYDNDELMEVNMHTGRYTDMRCPKASYFTINATPEEAAIGAESITIDASKSN